MVLLGRWLEERVWKFGVAMDGATNISLAEFRSLSEREKNTPTAEWREDLLMNTQDAFDEYKEQVTDHNDQDLQDFQKKRLMIATNCTRSGLRVSPTAAPRSRSRCQNPNVTTTWCLLQLTTPIRASRRLRLRPIRIFSNPANPANLREPHHRDRLGTPRGFAGTAAAQRSQP